MRVCILSGSPPHANEAVGDFSWLLAKELSRQCEVSLVVPRGRNFRGSDSASVCVQEVCEGWGPRACRQALRAIILRKPDIVLVQFVPQLYGWNGAKPFLALLLRSLKRRGYPVVTVAHEFSAPFGASPRSKFLALLHGVLLRRIVEASQGLVLTTDYCLDQFRRVFPRRQSDFWRIPVGLTVPVVSQDSESRKELRDRLGIRSDELLLGSIASPGSTDIGLLFAFARWVVAQRWPARFMLVGEKGPAVKARLPRVGGVLERILCTGPLSEEVFSRCLGASDLCVAYYRDGASSRRASLVTALAHGLPTVSNAGELTDSRLALSGALCLVSNVVDASELRPVAELCTNPAARRELGRRARLFFEEHWSWPKLAGEYLKVLDCVGRP